jgi:hypothetical protein
MEAAANTILSYNPRILQSLAKEGTSNAGPIP